MPPVARYNRISQAYWQRSRNWEERTRTLGAYLHTCRHSSGEGFYAISVAYMADDLAYTPAHVNKALKQLVDAREVMYDDNAGVVFVPESLELQPPTTERQIKGAIARISQVPPTGLLAALHAHANTHANGLAEAIANELPAQLQQAIRMETQSHSNANPESIRMGGLRVAS